MCVSFHLGRLRALRLLALTLPIFALSASTAMRAQQEPAPGKKTASGLVAQRAPASVNLPAFDIKIETFETQAVFGHKIGVAADITNNSDVSVYLRDGDLQFCVPPEVTSERNSPVMCYDGWFPTEWKTSPGVIALKPRETYRVFPSSQLAEKPEQKMGPQGSGQPPQKKISRFSKAGSWIRDQVDSIAFTPGTYPISVEVKYWENGTFDQQDYYHTAVAAKMLNFAAPEWVILFGASFGGVIFTILAMIRAKEGGVATGQSEPWNGPKSLPNAALVILGSILLSVTVTILLSRIAETQFFIKVSVSDLWGAIAVGFLANYGGWALLDKMLGRTTNGGEQKKDG